jgi:MmyB-like transcription regulator ligand binding domain/Putative restriction endonuclease
VLRLDPAEHRHLFVLARGHPPADPTDAPAVVDARLQAVLDALPYPAYAATNGWTVVAWNRAARLVFADYDALSGRERNIIWMAFTDPAAARTGEVSRLCPAVQGGTAREMARKVSEYFAAGCRLVWVVDPRTRTVAVYTSVAKPIVVTEKQTLAGGDVLPGFRLPLRKLFGLRA